MTTTTGRPPAYVLDPACDALRVALVELDVPVRDGADYEELRADVNLCLILGAAEVAELKRTVSVRRVRRTLDCLATWYPEAPEAELVNELFGIYVAPGVVS